MSRVPPDPDWVALEAGIKPAVRITLAPAQAPRLSAVLTARGATVLTAPKRVRFGDGEPEMVLYVSRAPGAAAALREAERATFDDDGSMDSGRRRRAHARMGELLGYPSCCVSAYLDRSEAYEAPTGGALAEAHEDWWQSRAALAATAGTPQAALNALLQASRVRLITFYPCRFDCADALAFAEAVSRAMRRKDAEATEALEAQLACTVALAPDGGRAILRATATPSETWTLAQPPDRPHGGPMPTRDEGFAAMLSDRLARRLPVPERTLVIAFGRAR